MSHTWMSHDPRINEFWNTFESEWVVVYIWTNESCHTYHCVTHTNESCHTYEWVMAHIWMNESSRTYNCVMTHMNFSRHTYEWVMVRIGMSHCTHMNGLWHTNGWVMAYTCMSHGTHMNESWHTCEYIWTRHVTHTNQRRLRCAGNARIRRVKSQADIVHRVTHRRLAFLVSSVRQHYTATHCNTLQHTATHCNTL